MTVTTTTMPKKHDEIRWDSSLFGGQGPSGRGSVGTEIGKGKRRKWTTSYLAWDSPDVFAGRRYSEPVFRWELGSRCLLGFSKQEWVIVTQSLDIYSRVGGRIYRVWVGHVWLIIRYNPWEKDLRAPNFLIFTTVKNHSYLERFIPVDG